MAFVQALRVGITRTVLLIAGVVSYSRVDSKLRRSRHLLRPLPTVATEALWLALRDQTQQSHAVMPGPQQTLEIRGIWLGYGQGNASFAPSAHGPADTAELLHFLLTRHEGKKHEQDAEIGLLNEANLRSIGSSRRLQGHHKERIQESFNVGRYGVCTGFEGGDNSHGPSDSGSCLIQPCCQQVTTVTPPAQAFANCRN